MRICYKCQEATFLKEYYEMIDGEERIVCGKCRTMACAVCGKTKAEGNISAWKYENNPGTGKLEPVCNRCTFVEGLLNQANLAFDRYENLQKNRPDLVEKMDENSRRRSAQAQQVLGNKNVADKLIDNWATRKKTTKKQK